MSQNHRLGLGEIGGPTGLPFDDVKAVLRHFPDADGAVAAAARDILGHGSPGVRLGSMADLAAWLAGWKGSLRPAVEKVELALFVSRIAALGDVDRAGEAYTFMASVSSGAHLASQLCQRHGVGLKVYDLALEVDVPDPRLGPAMSEEECAATMAFGMEATAGIDVLALGRAGEGGDVAALALLTLLMPDAAEQIAAGFSLSAQAAAQEIATHHQGAERDPFEALRRVGSRDLAALTGAILAARAQRMPVILDGLGPLAAAAVLALSGEGNLTHCLLGATTSPALGRLASPLGISNFAALASAEGEGVGALLAVPMVRAAADALTVAGISKDAAAA